MRQTRRQKLFGDRCQVIITILYRNKYPMLVTDIARKFNEMKFENCIGWMTTDMYRSLKTLEKKGLVKSEKGEWSLVENATDK